MKASDEWLSGQNKVLKINLRHEMIRLEKRRTKKLQLRIDNRSIDDLINEIKY